MGIESRDYYRRSHSGGAWADWGLYQMTPVVKYLIIANVIVFVLQMFVVREVHQSPLDYLRKQDPELDQLLKEKGDDPAGLQEVKKDYPELDKQIREINRNAKYFLVQRVSIVQEWFELDAQKVVSGGQVWRLLTHAFCHRRGDLFHILFNMLLLYWFGCTLESMYGSREFLLFYLTAAIVAALAYVGLELFTNSNIPGVGASGAVMAVAMLYATHFPRETFRIFWFWPVEMRWIVLVYVIFDLHPVLLALAGEPQMTGIGNAAHLGGFAFGFCYSHWQWRLDRFGDRLPGLAFRRRSRPILRLRPDPDLEIPANAEMRRVDQLLAKIHDSGQASLTDDEREFLRKASERMKSRRPREDS
jgi:membrane associated rhomboid family serine protease